MLRQIRMLSGIAVLAVTAIAGEPVFAQATAAVSGPESDIASATSTSLPTIVQIAAGDPDFSILVTALTDTGLAKTLEGKGPFTVFAPTNEAFAKLPQGLLAYLVSNPSILKSVLLYHVAPGSDALTSGSIKTVEGERVFPTVSLRVNGQTLVKVNNSTVSVKPIQASNGVIYVIDSVLLPQF